MVEMDMSTGVAGFTGEPSLWSFGTGALLAVVVAVLSACILNMSLKRKRYNLPPGPRAFPVIGNMLDMNGGEMQEKWWHLAQTKNWPVMSFKFSSKLIIIVSSSEATKEMLVTKGNLFNSRDKDTYLNLALRKSPDGKTDCGVLFTPHGPAWKITRRLMVAGQHEFKKVMGDDYIVKVLLPQLYKEIDGEVCINARIRIAKMMVIRILMVFVFGPGAEDYADMIVPLNDELFHVIDTNNAIEFFLPILARQASWVYYTLFQKGLVARKHKAYEFILSERGIKSQYGTGRLYSSAWFLPSTRHGSCMRAILVAYNTLREYVPATYNKAKQWSMCDMVQAAEKNGQITHHQGLQIYEECFFGGQDTTGAAIEGILKMLVETPRVLLKVQQEIDDVLGTAKHLRFSDAEGLPYLQAVIKEGLRLHRAIPVLTPHASHVDTTLGGYDIPKDTLVTVNVWGLARDPTIFPDPYVVRPERFLEWDTNFSGSDCKYVAFGVGQRICPGQTLALFMINILVGSLCQRYSFSIGNDWKHERDEGTFFKERALYLNLTKRDGAPHVM